MIESFLSTWFAIETIHSTQTAVLRNTNSSSAKGRNTSRKLRAKIIRPCDAEAQDENGDEQHDVWWDSTKLSFREWLPATHPRHTLAFAYGASSRGIWLRFFFLSQQEKALSRLFGSSRSSQPPETTRQFPACPLTTRLCRTFALVAKKRGEQTKRREKRPPKFPDQLSLVDAVTLLAANFSDRHDCAERTTCTHSRYNCWRATGEQDLKAAEPWRHARTHSRTRPIGPVLSPRSPYNERCAGFVLRRSQHTPFNEERCFFRGRMIKGDFFDTTRSRIIDRADARRGKLWLENVEVWKMKTSFEDFNRYEYKELYFRMFVIVFHR